MGSHRVQGPRKSWLVIGGIILAIAVAGGGSTLALMRQSNEVPAVPTAAPVQTTTVPTETPSPAFVPRTDAPAVTSTNRPRSTTTTPRTTTRTTSTRSNLRCTNQRDYAMDPRSNAEINSIGEETGTCPKPQTMTDARTIDPDSSGESQLQWLCQQGMIEEAACH